MVFFVSYVSETYSNLSEMPDEILVHSLQHVPGDFNPADIPTRVRPKPNSSAELFGSAIVRLRFRGTELSILKVRLRLRGTELFEKKFLLNRTVRPNI